MSFLDLQIIRGDKEFTTSLYCKPTYFDSFLPSNYKFDTIWIIPGYTQVVLKYTLNYF